MSSSLEMQVCDINKIKEELFEQKPLNSEAGYCFFKAIFDGVKDSYVLLRKIRYLFREINRIGAESVYGAVYHVSIVGTQFSLACKLSQYGSSKRGELIHETIIGLHYLNLLRNRIPNFVYIYGLFRGSVPFINKEGKPVLFGDQARKDRESNYMIMEEIPDAVTFGNFFSICTVRDTLDILSQTCNALLLAGKEYKFTHMDLHFNNLLIRINASWIDSEHDVTYQHTAMIIDFGMSSVENRSADQAVPSAGETRRYYALRDMYRMICFLGLLIRVNDNISYREAKFDVLEDIFSNTFVDFETDFNDAITRKAQTDNYDYKWGHIEDLEHLNNILRRKLAEYPADRELVAQPYTQEAVKFQHRSNIYDVQGLSIAIESIQSINNAERSSALIQRLIQNNSYLVDEIKSNIEFFTIPYIETRISTLRDITRRWNSRISVQTFARDNFLEDEFITEDVAYIQDLIHEYDQLYGTYLLYLHYRQYYSFEQTMSTAELSSYMHKFNLTILDLIEILRLTMMTIRTRAIKPRKTDIEGIRKYNRKIVRLNLLINSMNVKIEVNTEALSEMV